MMSVPSATSGIAARMRGDEREVALAGVGASHRLQDARRAGLERQMDVLADRVALGDRGDHGLAEVLRVRAREADPLDSVDGVAGAEQLAELGADLGQQIAAPGVDVLAEQGDLFDAVRAQAGSPRRSPRPAAGSARVRGRRGRCSTSRSSCSPSRPGSRPGTSARGASAASRRTHGRRVRSGRARRRPHPRRASRRGARSTRARRRRRPRDRARRSARAAPRRSSRRRRSRGPGSSRLRAIASPR